MRIFLAGIMQGSHLGTVLHNQDYRARLKELFKLHMPEADVYDPLADHGNSLEYDEEQGRSVFFHHCRLCGDVDVVVSFVSEASMGTAIEMWQAYESGKAVLTISPLKHNWVVRFLSHEIYRDLDDFAAALASGKVASRLSEILGRRARRGPASEQCSGERIAHLS